MTSGLRVVQMPVVIGRDDRIVAVLEQTQHVGGNIFFKMSMMEPWVRALFTGRRQYVAAGCKWQLLIDLKAIACEASYVDAETVGEAIDGLGLDEGQVVKKNPSAGRYCQSMSSFAALTLGPLWIIE